jgi:glycine cleavage system H lipoate-binding protein
MVVLLVALTFVICFLIDRLANQKPNIPHSIWIQPDQAFQKTLGVEYRVDGYRIRSNVYFHTGHMWVKPEGPHRARIGLDDFACQLNAPIHTITRTHEHQLRQGAPCLRIHTHAHTIDLLAPIGGKIIATNETVFQNPNQMTTDPFGAWLFVVENKHLPTEQNNLIQGEWVFVWVEQEAAQLRQSYRMGLHINDAFLNTFFGHEAASCSGH